MKSAPGCRVPITLYEGFIKCLYKCCADQHSLNEQPGLKFHAVWHVERKADNSSASCNYVLLMIQKASEEHFSERTYTLLPKAVLTGL